MTKKQKRGWPRRDEKTLPKMTRKSAQAQRDKVAPKVTLKQTPWENADA